MKRIVATLAGVWALGMAPGSTGVFAQPAPAAVRIAVVDVQALMQNSAAASNARSQIEALRTAYQKEFETKQEDLNKLLQKLAAQRPTLPKAAYQQRIGELEQRATSYQNDTQERQDKLDRALGAASQAISAAITQVVDEIMRERQLMLVLPRSISIGTPTAPDITQEVLTRLNKRMPAVTIDLPK